MGSVIFHQLTISSIISPNIASREPSGLQTSDLEAFYLDSVSCVLELATLKQFTHVKDDGFFFFFDSSKKVPKLYQTPERKAKTGRSAQELEGNMNHLQHAGQQKHFGPNVTFFFLFRPSILFAS